MLDKNFCEILEYRMCEAFKKMDDENVKGFWCDGVLLSEPDNYYSQKFVNDNKQVKMKAFVGEDGETDYCLTLRFGNSALSKYARNLGIVECIPQGDLTDWFKIDILKRVIEVQLD